MISPGDVLEERDTLTQMISSWNAQIGAGLNTRVELVRWESHATPDMSGTAQSIINTQLVGDCDLGIAVFWSRLGTPTAIYLSGSVEKIYRLIQNGARVLVYFCNRPIPQEALRDDQFPKLQEVRKRFEDEGLLSTYTAVQNLREQVQLHLTNVITQLLSKDRGATTYIPVSGTLTAPAPDVRVYVRVGIFAPPIGEPIELLIIIVENHSPVVVYLSQIFLELQTNEWLFLKRDFVTGELNSHRQLNPGQRIDLHISPDEIRKFQSKGFICAAAKDEINRIYRSSQSELQNAVRSLLKD